MRLFGTILVACTALLAGPAIAATQDEDVDERAESAVDRAGEETREAADEAGDRFREMRSRGIEVHVGGGFTGFTDDSVLDVTEDVGGNWTAGVMFGARSPLAVEASYQGASYGVNVVGSNDEANIVATGFNGHLRYNFTTDEALQPYALAGLGFKHYELYDEDTATSSAIQDDNVMEIPLGVGVAYRFDPIVADVRGMISPAVGSELVVADDDASLTNWTLRVGLGWEF